MEQMEMMKREWRMWRERRINGLTTYFSFCFYFCTTYLNELFCGLERCWSEFRGGGVT